MQDAFYIPSPVHALPGAAFHRLELRELGFPEAQHVGREPAQNSHFADAEIQLIGNEDFIGLILARGFFSRTHTRIDGSRPAPSQYCDTGEGSI